MSKCDSVLTYCQARRFNINTPLTDYCTTIIATFSKTGALITLLLSHSRRLRIKQLRHGRGHRPVGKLAPGDAGYRAAHDGRNGGACHDGVSPAVFIREPPHHRLGQPRGQEPVAELPALQLPQYTTGHPVCQHVRKAPLLQPRHGRKLGPYPVERPPR